MANEKIISVKGINDIVGERAKLYKEIIEICEGVARNYGFEFINTPHLEFTTLFKRSVGESSDIVGKEMYEFIDKGENAVCLRPEGTAGIVRAYIQNGLNGKMGVKRLFYHGSMFRRERPQKGRLREFHQFGVESFGTKNVYEDATLILMIAQIFKCLEKKYNLKIKTKLKINSLGCEKCSPEFRIKFLEFIGTKHGFCEDCERRKKLNPIRMLDCKNEHCQVLLKNAPKMSECLCNECKRDFDTLKELLKDNEISFECDDKLVRGLDYYSKTAFEFESDEIGAKAAVAGGGRYDKLIEQLGGGNDYGVGFALGIERLMLILEKKEQEREVKREGIYICTSNEKYLKPLFKFATNLRKANKKVFLNYLYKKNSEWHLSNADKSKKAEFLIEFRDDILDLDIFINKCFKVLGEQGKSMDYRQKNAQLKRAISTTKKIEKVLRDLKKTLI